MKKEDEVKYLTTRMNFYKKEIPKLEKDIREAGTVIYTNNNKTACQNPNIKTLNEYTKNLLAVYRKITEFEGESEGGSTDGSILSFLQKGNSRRSN